MYIISYISFFPISFFSSFIQFRSHFSFLFQKFLCASLSSHKVFLVQTLVNLNSERVSTYVAKNIGSDIRGHIVWNKGGMSAQSQSSIYTTPTNWTAKSIDVILAIGIIFKCESNKLEGPWYSWYWNLNLHS